jgi:hypothetical protein
LGTPDSTLIQPHNRTSGIERQRLETAARRESPARDRKKQKKEASAGGSNLPGGSLAVNPIRPLSHLSRRASLGHPAIDVFRRTGHQEGICRRRDQHATFRPENQAASFSSSIRSFQPCLLPTSPHAGRGATRQFLPNRRRIARVPDIRVGCSQCGPLSILTPHSSKAGRSRRPGAVVVRTGALPQEGAGALHAGRSCGVCSGERSPREPLSSKCESRVGQPCFSHI